MDWRPRWVVHLVWPCCCQKETSGSPGNTFYWILLTFLLFFLPPFWSFPLFTPTHQFSLSYRSYKNKFLVKRLQTINLFLIMTSPALPSVCEITSKTYRLRPGFHQIQTHLWKIKIKSGVDLLTYFCESRSTFDGHLVHIPGGTWSFEVQLMTVKESRWFADLEFQRASRSSHPHQTDGSRRILWVGVFSWQEGFSFDCNPRRNPH